MRKKKQRSTTREMPKSQIYSFEVDSDEVLKKKGDVVFVMNLHEGADPNKVKSKLEELSAEVGYANYMKHLGALVCVTNQTTYERIFETQLELNPIKKGQKGYTTEGYGELKPATIPSELSDIVHSVFLNYCDQG